MSYMKTPPHGGRMFRCKHARHVMGVLGEIDGQPWVAVSVRVSKESAQRHGLSGRTLWRFVVPDETGRYVMKCRRCTNRSHMSGKKRKVQISGREVLKALSVPGTVLVPVPPRDELDPLTGMEF